jgi:predicted Zn-dependent protease
MQVVVLDDQTVNAFVLPGGKIVVFTGQCELLLVVNSCSNATCMVAYQLCIRHHVMLPGGCSCSSEL